jgi:hypothetical protein
MCPEMSDSFLPASGKSRQDQKESSAQKRSAEIDGEETRVERQ